MKYADLHVHTHYSDSTFSPKEVIECAKKRALDGIAICDHDCIDGIEPCKKLGDECGVEVIPGIEFSCDRGDAEIHMLGYFVGYKLPWFKKYLKLIQESRIKRIYVIAKKLDKIGIKLDPDAVIAIGGKSTVSRLHVAHTLIATNIVKNVRQAFERYLGFGKPAYEPSVKLLPEEAVKIILKAGGVPVVAHPYLIGNDKFVDELLDYGLRGVEVYHSDHRAHTTRHYEEFAKERDLIMTGGSDCHGNNKGRVLMGTIRVPYTVVEELRSESENIKK